MGPRLRLVAERLGLPPMPWQQQVFDVAGELLDDGRPAYRQVWVTVPRQSGKTTVSLSLEVDRCLNWGTPQRVAYSAQTRDDAAKKLVDDQMPILETSRLFAAVRKMGKGIGNENVAWKNGSRIVVLSTQPTSGHGKTLDFAVLDEYFADQDLRREQAVRPAQITKTHAQVLGLSTAGTADSWPLWRKVTEGRAAVEAGETDGLAYFEWSAPDGCDWRDEDVWRACMPALGHTIDPDLIRFEARTLEENEFRRAYLNQWTQTDTRLIPQQVWSQVCSPEYQCRGDLVYALDCPPDRSSAAVGCADRFGTVELGEHRPGVGWAVGWCVDLHARRGARFVVDGSGPAGGLGVELERAGVPVGFLRPQEMARASTRFYDAVTAGLMQVRSHRSLDDAVAGVRKVKLGDTWRFGRLGSADVSPLIAVTLAAWAAAEPDQEEPAPLVMMIGGR